MHDELIISHPPGNFVYIVRDKDGKALYVGGTSNIDKKSFSFSYEYSSITGYYYEFPDFEDEIDRVICKLNPVYNKSLHSFRTKKQWMIETKAIFAKYGLPFRKAEKELFNEYLSDMDYFLFRGDAYFSDMDARIAIYDMLECYGKDYFKS